SESAGWEGVFRVRGPRENVSRHARLFATVNKTNHIFRRRGQQDRRLPEFPLTAPDPRRRRAPIAAHPGPADDSLNVIAERQMLERYAPAYVVVNQDGEGLSSSGRTGKYLEMPAGAPTRSIYAMARPGLRLDLRAAVHKAAATGQPAMQNHIEIGTNGGQQLIDLIVQPIRPPGADDPSYMVIFRDLGGIRLTADQEER